MTDIAKLKKFEADCVTEEFTIYSMGICFASVCTSLPAEEATERLNTLTDSIAPGGSRWAITEERFKGGNPNPCPCDQKPTTHKHFLFSC